MRADFLEKGQARRALTALLAGFAAIHLVLCVLDVHYPWTFLRADRATGRLDALVGLIHAGGWANTIHYLGEHGNLGDYAPQAVIYGLLGKPGLIASQIALMLYSGLCVYRLGKLTGLSERGGCVAAGIYLVSPHSLVFPHQLSSEAMYLPLFAIATWMTCTAIQQGGNRVLGGSALLLGLATLIRPISLFWPAVIGAVLICAKRWKSAAAFVVTAYLPIALWAAFILNQTGTFGLGESDHTLAVNLYGKVESVAATLPDKQRKAIADRYLAGVPNTKFSTGEYLSFGLHYPLPLLTYMGRDALIFLLKSGVERITIDYLADVQQAESLQTPSGDSWRQHFDKYGVIEAMRYGWQVLGAAFLISAAASVVQAILTLFWAIGTVRIFAAASDQAVTVPVRIIDSIVAALPIYIFVFSLVVIAAQSRQRAPAEFAIAILAVHGFGRRRVHRDSA